MFFIRRRTNRHLRHLAPHHCHPYLAFRPEPGDKSSGEDKSIEITMKYRNAQGSAPGLMQFTARDRMALALAEDAAAIIELAGCQVELLASSGSMLEPGTPILSARGPASALLRSWKVAQTLIEVWSGVATEARAIVTAATAVAPNIVVACTRKNIPGTKCFAVAAVKAGGAVMHRLGLSETILVFPEHRAFLREMPLAELVRQLRRAAPEKRLVIEVTTF